MLVERVDGADEFRTRLIPSGQRPGSVVVVHRTRDVHEVGESSPLGLEPEEARAVTSPCPGTPGRRVDAGQRAAARVQVGCDGIRELIDRVLALLVREQIDTHRVRGHRCDFEALVAHLGRLHLRQLSVRKYGELDILALAATGISSAEVDRDQRGDDRNDEVDQQRKSEPHDCRTLDEPASGGLPPALRNAGVLAGLLGVLTQVSQSVAGRLPARSRDRSGGSSLITTRFV